MPRCEDLGRELEEFENPCKIVDVLGLKEIRMLVWRLEFEAIFAARLASILDGVGVPDGSNKEIVNKIKLIKVMMLIVQIEIRAVRVQQLGYEKSGRFIGMFGTFMEVPPYIICRLCELYKDFTKVLLQQNCVNAKGLNRPIFCNNQPLCEIYQVQK